MTLRVRKASSRPGDILYAVITTPRLLIDGQGVATGQSPSTSEIAPMPDTARYDIVKA